MTRLIRFLTANSFAALMLLASVAILNSVIRLVAPFVIDRTAGVELFEQRYLDHPIITALHILPGLLFLLIGPFQFRPRLRQRLPGLHRIMGRVFILCGLLSAGSVMWLVIAFPALGGGLTIAMIWVFAPWMIWALVQAYRSIRARNVPAHRVWMIRAYAVGLAVATIRLLGSIGGVAFGYDLLQHFQWYMLFGLSLHVAGTEALMHLRGLLPLRKSATNMARNREAA